MHVQIADVGEWVLLYNFWTVVVTVDGIFLVGRGGGGGVCKQSLSSLERPCKAQGS